MTIDQANAEFVGLAKRMAADNPKTNKQLVSASVLPLLNAFTGPQLRQTVFGDARARCYRRLAHRLRQRDEHAIRARRLARQENWQYEARSGRPAGGSFGKC